MIKQCAVLCDTEVKVAVDIATQNTPLTSMTPVLRCRLHGSGRTQKMEEVVGSRNSCIVGYTAVVEVAAKQTDGMMNRRCMTEV